MRILVDYRPALRVRTGVGEYIHEMVRAYTALHRDEVAVFTSSWKDRPAPGLAATLGAEVIDRRIPGKALNYLWHRRGWPPVETLAGPFDIVHAAHPLAIPARTAAQIVTIHDLFFLDHPEATSGEIRRDYVALAAPHARRAHAVVTSTEHGRSLVINQLGVAPHHVHVCTAGAPEWQALGRGPNVPAGGYALFLGSLEPRKNVGALLDAWELLIQRGITTPLVLAGRSSNPAATAWLERIAQPPLSGHVTYRGYVEHAQREALFTGARLLMLPSLDEGFGLTALEAMSAGVPLVASNRGSLPEVVGDGGMLVDPTHVNELAAVIARMLIDEGAARSYATAGLTRAKQFTWEKGAVALRQAYVDALARCQAGAKRAHRH